jgi:hypothetical protein
VKKPEKIQPPGTFHLYPTHQEMIFRELHILPKKNKKKEKFLCHILRPSGGIFSTFFSE